MVLQHAFKDLRTGNVVKEIKWIEALLQEDICYSVDSEELPKYKALEKQRNKLLRIKRLCGGKEVELFGLQMVIAIQKFSHGKADQRRKTNMIKRLKDRSGR